MAIRLFARRLLEAGLIAAVVLGRSVALAETGTVHPSVPLAAPVPFHEQTVRLANGILGRPVSVASANPRNYEDIIQRRGMPAVALQAKLFVPPHRGKVPAVIIMPGSGGVISSLLVHANALTNIGIAVFLVDPFGGRGVRDTIAAQDQFSFAASSYDVFASMRALEHESEVDTARIGALGYSRGGLAVLQAAVTPLSAAALGGGRNLRAVLAAWPWCGQQFADPRTAPTAVRYLLADSDAWVGPVQCQAYFSAMKTRNGAASLRLFRNAEHGFGYDIPVHELPHAIKALNAPIAYYDQRGVLQDPWSGQPLPGADDRTMAEMYRHFITRGVRAGSREKQMAEFVADVVAFFKAELSP